MFDYANDYDLEWISFSSHRESGFHKLSTAAVIQPSSKTMLVPHGHLFNKDLQISFNGVHKHYISISKPNNEQTTVWSSM